MTTVSTIQERISLPGAALAQPRETAAPPTASEIWAMLRRRTVLIVFLSFLFSGIARIADPELGLE